MSCAHSLCPVSIVLCCISLQEDIDGESDEFFEEDDLGDKDGPPGDSARAPTARSGQSGEAPSTRDKALGPLQVVEMDVPAIFDMYFVLALVWSIGGNLVDHDRAKVCESAGAMD